MLKLLFCLGILLTASHASKPLYENIEWSVLFHISNGEQSDISDSSFYLSKEKTLKSEYDAALSILKTSDSQKAICKFPARFRYLKQKLDLNLSFESCDNLQQFLEESRGEYASITFASSYLESPMSYFGHTFITIHKHNNRFFSQTISFAAEVPEKTNFFELATKGIGGGFVGRFVASPYFKLFEGYNLVEQRGLTEYRLDLTQEEIENMLWHVYELYDIGVDYKFLTNNCAFETLWLLEVARPGMGISNEFKSVVIPYGTIVHMKAMGMINEIRTQPPLIESMYKTYSSLDSEEKDFFSLIKNNDHKAKIIQETNLSSSSKNKMGYLINGYYDILFKRFRMGKSDFNEVKSIPYLPTSELVSGEPTRRGGSKIDLGYSNGNGVSSSYVTLKPYSFNRREDRYSELGDATLEILSTKIEHVQDNTRLDELSIILIESHTKRFDFYNPVSWKINLGADRSLMNRDNLEPVAQIAIGSSLGSESLLAYCMPQISLYPIVGIVGVDTLMGIGFWENGYHIGLDTKIPVIYSEKKSDFDITGYFVVPLSLETSFKVLIGNDRIGMVAAYQF